MNIQVDDVVACKIAGRSGTELVVVTSITASHETFGCHRYDGREDTNKAFWLAFHDDIIFHLSANINLLADL